MVRIHSAVLCRLSYGPQSGNEEDERMKNETKPAGNGRLLYPAAFIPHPYPSYFILFNWQG